MNLELCKFPCVYLTRFRLVKKQTATVKAHTCALSWHGPLNKAKCTSDDTSRVFFLMCLDIAPTTSLSADGTTMNSAVEGDQLGMCQNWAWLYPAFVFLHRHCECLPLERWATVLSWKLVRGHVTPVVFFCSSEPCSCWLVVFLESI